MYFCWWDIHKDCRQNYSTGVSACCHQCDWSCDEALTNCSQRWHTTGSWQLLFNAHSVSVPPFTPGPWSPISGLDPKSPEFSSNSHTLQHISKVHFNIILALCFTWSLFSTYSNYIFVPVSYLSLPIIMFFPSVSLAAATTVLPAILF
jgi:hypothetical protein